MLKTRINKNFIYFNSNEAYGLLDANHYKKNPDILLDAILRVIKKYQISDYIIEKIYNLGITKEMATDDVMEFFCGTKDANLNNNQKLMDKLMEFCYWCSILDKNNIKGLRGLIEKVKNYANYPQGEYHNILHDFTVADFALRYLFSGHKVTILTSSNEKGVDLVINGLKCEVKTFLGYLRHTVNDLYDSMVKNISSFNLIQELGGLWNKINYARVRQKADVIFIDMTHTDIFLLNYEFFTKPNVSKKHILPKLKKKKLKKGEFVLILHFKSSEGDFWSEYKFKSYFELERALFNVKN